MPEDNSGGSDNFQKRLRQQLESRVVMLVDESLNFLANEDTAAAYQKILQARQFKLPVRHLEYVHAICLVKMERPREAAEALQLELGQFPGNEEAEALLSDLLSAAQAQDPALLQTSQDGMPIHFFTIVLNGMPFIKYHLDVFKKLPFAWHWHIIEGVAQLKHCTAWAVQNGGKITDAFHAQGRSLDGTSEYLDQLAQTHPGQVTIYRKPAGQFWEGKLEMVNAPLPHIKTAGLLWQIDADELWHADQIIKARELFLDHPEKTAAFYYCHFLVGENLVTCSRNCYANNPSVEWLRTWRFQPGCRFASHEPPKLCRPIADGKFVELASLNPFNHQETESAGLVFQHYAYVIEKQLEFKEVYYGYHNAVMSWRALQETKKLPALLRNYFPWVTDNTVVDSVGTQKIKLLARKNTAGDWQFSPANGFQESPPEPAPLKSGPISGAHPLIAIDGVFFDMYRSGIARLWEALLREFAKTDFAPHLLILDRNQSAPRIAGLRYRPLPRYDARLWAISRKEFEPLYPQLWAEDRRMLQRVCDEEQVDLFISTYYTTVETTPSAQMVYDMIPEVFGYANDGHPQWIDKHRAIRQALAYLCISDSTRKDLLRFFPEIDALRTAVTPCGIDTGTFRRAAPEKVLDFHKRFNLHKPYFLLVGGKADYKNARMFFEAVAMLSTQHGFQVVVTGGEFSEADLGGLRTGCDIVSAKFSQEDLLAAYSGAVALVYPSAYEGFGLPVLEAMACDCPVICTPFSSLPEVGGDAVWYVKDAQELALALCEIQKPAVQTKLIQAGRARLKLFSWEASAGKVRAALEKATSGAAQLKPGVLP